MKYIFSANILTKIIAISLLCNMLFFNISYAETLEYKKPYIVIDASNGDILARNRIFDSWYPASVTKMMTTYLTFKYMKKGLVKKTTPVRLSKYAVSQAPSCSGYRAGTILTIDTALKIMLVKSTNDIAVALADCIGGDQEKFVKMMNDQAQALGMVDTHFANANGLPNKNNYSTARDLALLALAIRRDFPQYAYYFDIEAIDTGRDNEPILNSNNLLGRFDGIDGMKTGFICSSGYNLVASATRGGHTMIAVVLGASRLDIREEVAANLLEIGFHSAGKGNFGNIYDEPSAHIQMKAPDLRNEVCTLEALKKRRPFLDKKFRPILMSPYINDYKENFSVISVRPIYEPKAPPCKKPKAKHRRHAS